ncbi:hypothetical protein ACWCQQ_49345, partial [Streptomyces sp. NPDC002143]
VSAVPGSRSPSRMPALICRASSPATRTEAEADFLQIRRLGVDSYPTLLLHTTHGTDRLGGPVSSADALTHALDQHLATAPAA